MDAAELLAEKEEEEEEMGTRINRLSLPVQKIPGSYFKIKVKRVKKMV